MFERATKLKLRFNFKGQCTTEDLWDLKENDLDLIYRDLKEDEKAVCGNGLIMRSNKAADTLKLKQDIVKHIFDAKRAEAEARKNAAENRIRRDRLKTVLAQKQDEKLLGMSEADLQKEIEALD